MYVGALQSLFATEVPHAYFIGDTSDKGFGSGVQYPDLLFEGRDGFWNSKFSLGGSNLREGQNMAIHLLMDIKSGKHDGCEVLCFTDNSVSLVLCLDKRVIYRKTFVLPGSGITNCCQGS